MKCAFAFCVTRIAVSFIAASAIALSPGVNADDSLWSHVHSTDDLGELRGMSAEWSGDALRLNVMPRSETQAERFRYSWAVLPPPDGGWDLADAESVEAEIINHGSEQLDVILWVVGDRGWDAVPDAESLAPNESRRFSCSLRDVYPDQTPKIDPAQIKQIQFMLSGRVSQSLTLEVRDLKSVGSAPAWQRPSSRLDVPPVTDASPAPGTRVRYRLPGDEHSGLYSVLNLPQDWQSGKRYPVIVEYPGNIFFTSGCYSNGLPDQCVIGYGITQGSGAICLSLPFIDRAAGVIIESGWGNADDTADYAADMVEEICAKYGGDRENLVLTGFSRGALACGYIGLRNERIAALWKGFHACQHYDGDGWRGATMEGALERAARFRGRAVFQTDNQQKTFQPLMDAMKAEVTWAESGLGAHATAMFLDDRPSTQQLRGWFWKLVEEKTP